MENRSFLFGQNSHDIGDQQDTIRHNLDLKQDTEEYPEFDYLKIVQNKVCNYRVHLYIVHLFKKHLNILLVLIYDLDMILY